MLLEVFTTFIWWTTHFFRQKFGFSHERAAVLMRNGLIKLADLWDDNTCVSRMGGVPNQVWFFSQERRAFNTLDAAFPEHWRYLLTVGRGLTRKKEFIGIFFQEQDQVLIVIFETQKNFRPVLTPRPVFFYFPTEILYNRLNVLLAAFVAQCITRRGIWAIPWLAQAGARGWVLLEKDFCSMETEELMFNTGRWRRGKVGQLLSFNTKNRRKLLSPRKKLTRTIREKRDGRINHGEVCLKTRLLKDPPSSSLLHFL